jgi:ribosomal protein L28
MENFDTVKKYIHQLTFDPLLRPFGHAKQKLQRLSRRRFWPNLQTAAARKPFMGYRKFL